MTSDDSGTVFLDWALTYDGYRRLASGPDDLTVLVSHGRDAYERTGEVPRWCGVDFLRGWIFWLARRDHFDGYGHLVQHGTGANRELIAVVAALRAHPDAGPEDLPPPSTAAIWGGSEPAPLEAAAGGELPPDVAEGLGPYYVYALRDPRDGGVFYVGKGTGPRVISHVAAVKATGDDVTLTSAKVGRIRAILADGYEVEHLLLRVNIPTEEQAYVVEQAVLDGYAANGFELSNAVGGHHSDTHGLATLADALARLGAPPAPPLPEGSVVFIINRKWDQGSSAADVYEATHGHWKIGATSRSKAKVAFGVARGIIRGAYLIDDWYSATGPDQNGRWGFNGTVWEHAPDYIGTHVRDLTQTAGAGSQNPVRLFLSGT